MGIVEIENFPFPTPPPKVSLSRSVRLLEDIGAIPRQKKSTSLVDTTRSKNGKNLTSLGQLLAKFPINPRYSKMLVIAKQLGVIKHALSLVAILSEKSPFLDRVSSSKKRKKADDSDGSDDDENETNNDPKNVGLWFHPDGDALARLRALGAYIFTCSNAKDNKKQNKDDE
jgi:ATP-dependent RNA helicase DHX37/DHR1